MKSGLPRRFRQYAERDLAKILKCNPGRTGKIRSFQRWSGCVCQWRHQAILEQPHQENP